MSTLRRIVLPLALLLLAGCASTLPPAAVPVEVKVPVAVPCKVDLPQAPAFAVDALPLGADVWNQMLALRAERLQRMGYEGELVAAVRGCQ